VGDTVVEENFEECHDVWGRKGQVRVIKLYGVDQTVERTVMVGGVGEGDSGEDVVRTVVRLFVSHRGDNGDPLSCFESH
jgi:hypothetical protein